MSGVSSCPGTVNSLGRPVLDTSGGGTVISFKKPIGWTDGNDDKRPLLRELESRDIIDSNESLSNKQMISRTSVEKQEEGKTKKKTNLEPILPSST